MRGSVALGIVEKLFKTVAWGRPWRLLKNLASVLGFLHLPNARGPCARLRRRASAIEDMNRDARARPVLGAGTDRADQLVAARRTVGCELLGG